MEIGLQVKYKDSDLDRLLSAIKSESSNKNILRIKKFRAVLKYIINNDSSSYDTKTTLDQKMDDALTRLRNSDICLTTLYHYDEDSNVSLYPSNNSLIEYAEKRDCCGKYANYYKRATINIKELVENGQESVEIVLFIVDVHKNK
jgi:hypothetical protein